MTRRALIILAIALLAIAMPAAAQLQAPDREDVVAAVRSAHPEIDPCDEESLDKGRAAIVDWSAQRLNALEGRIRWGRKSRGRVVDGKADRPNTDGLTYLRADGRFEIYDVISGSRPCGTSWDGSGPFAPGENGYFAPPQLRPEGSTPPPPVDPRDAKIAELEKKLANSETALGGARARLQELEGQVATVERERDEARRALEDCQNKPPAECPAYRSVLHPGWIGRLGVRASCEVIVK